jgi:hypothetical protein
MSGRSYFEVLAFRSAQLPDQVHSSVMRNRQSGEAVLSHSDIERREALLGLGVQLGAMVNQELDDGIRSSQRCAV